MSNFSLKICIVSIFFLVTQTVEASQEDKTNIIVFLVDDLGWQDLSEPFYHQRTPNNDKFYTPNVERLASKGVKYVNAYACNVCSPSRVSLVSGQNSARHGVTNWTYKANKPCDNKKSRFKFNNWNFKGYQPGEMLNSVQFTALPELLSKDGYKTIHVGKAHFAAYNTPGEDPLSMGFDVNIAGSGAGAPPSYYNAKKYATMVGLEAYKGSNLFLTEVLTREAIKEMQKAIADEKPFFLHMSHYAVHTPIQKDMRYYEKYKKQGLGKREAAYASLVEGVDASLGKIMDFLEEKDIQNNTAIIFTSDNGGLSAYMRGGKKHTHNLPLSSGKGSVYEGGLRVPLIVMWPKMVETGELNEKMVQVEDLFPTILQIAGVKNTAKQTIDGVSLFNEKEREFLVWHYPNKWGFYGPGIGTWSAIRKDDWKLIYFYNQQKFELYNLKGDIGEKKNLAMQKPKKVRELAWELSEYLKKADASLPNYKFSKNKKLDWPIAYVLD